MKKNLRLICIASVLCVAFLAVAEGFRTPPTVAWDKVTQYEDGRTIETNAVVTYQVYRRTGTNNVNIGNTTNLFYTDATAQLRQTYTYTVAPVVWGIEAVASSNLVIMTYPPKAVGQPRIQ